MTKALNQTPKPQSVPPAPPGSTINPVKDLFQDVCVCMCVCVLPHI